MKQIFLQENSFGMGDSWGNNFNFSFDNGIDISEISSIAQEKMLKFLIILLHSSRLYKSFKDAYDIMGQDMIAMLPRPFSINSFAAFLLYDRSILYTERLLNQILEGADDDTLAYYMIRVVGEIYRNANISLEFDGKELYFLNK